jgi:hypothetical protein
LPVSSSEKQIDPLLQGALRMQTTWVGNADSFPYIWDLMIAASCHRQDSVYMLVKNGQVVERTDYHPMCGKMPPRGPDGFHHLDPRLKVIFLELVWFVKYFSNEVYFYSIFSANTSLIVLLVSYFKLDINALGTVQDKIMFYKEYREAIHAYAHDVLVSLISDIGLASLEDFATYVR